MHLFGKTKPFVLLFRMLCEDGINVDTAVRKLGDFKFNHFTGKRVAQSFPNVCSWLAVMVFIAQKNST